MLSAAIRGRWSFSSSSGGWLRWGNRDRGERKLPPTGWTWRATVEAGKWVGVEPQPVEVPASYALMNGVWFKVKRGIVDPENWTAG